MTAQVSWATQSWRELKSAALVRMQVGGSALRVMLRETHQNPDWEPSPDFATALRPRTNAGTHA